MLDLEFYINSHKTPEVKRIVKCFEVFSIPHTFTKYVDDKTIETNGGVSIRLDRHIPSAPERFMWTSPIAEVLSILGARDLLDLDRKTVAATPKHIGDVIRVKGQYAVVLTCGSVRSKRAIRKEVLRSKEPVLYEHVVAMIPEDFWYAAAGSFHVKAAYRGLCPGIDQQTLLGWRARELVDQHKLTPELFEHMVKGLSAEIAKCEERLFKIENWQNPEIDEIVDLTALEQITKIQWPVVREALMYTQVAALVQDGELCRLLNASNKTLELFRQQGVELGFKGL